MSRKCCMHTAGTCTPLLAPVPSTSDAVIRAHPGRAQASPSTRMTYIPGDAGLWARVQGLSGEGEMRVLRAGSQVWLRRADALVHVKPPLQLREALFRKHEALRGAERWGGWGFPTRETLHYVGRANLSGNNNSFILVEKEMATHSRVLAWRIPGTEEPGGLLSMGSQSRTRLKRLSSSIGYLSL